MITSAATLASPNFPTWCPGCGDFGIWSSLKMALSSLSIPQEDVVIVFGVGCSGNMADFIRCYGFHALHGRALSTAQGIKTANHRLKVIVVAGDGDTYGEGMGHFIASCRGNHDITLLVHDNQVYGLTTGQSAPTTPQGQHTKSTPQGQIDIPVNPISLAVSSGATFVARGYAGNIPLTTSLISQAIQHAGFSLVDVLQPCVTFNSTHSHMWYNDRVTPLEEKEFSAMEAIQLSQDLEKLPIGVFYKTQRPTYHESIELLHTKTLLESTPTTVDLSDELTAFA